MKQNFAFISYSHRDVRWAKWLRRKLEWYRLPSEIHNQCVDSRFIRPVFRDRDELDSGVLSKQLRQSLENSKYLIVICSPHASLSAWVSTEVQAFIEMGRLEYIIPFIVDGEPQHYDSIEACERPMTGECFPKALRAWNVEHPDETLLGIAITDDGKRNRQKAFVRVVSRMLGVTFDTLWQRHKREVRATLTALAAVVTVMLVLAYWFVIPVKLHVAIKDDPSATLPAMEYGTLTVDGKEFTVNHPDTIITAGTLPGYYRTRHIDIAFSANRYYTATSIQQEVTTGLEQTITIELKRDATFAVFAGQVIQVSQDGATQPLDKAQVVIDGQSVTTDSNGHFSIVFPVDMQTPTKPITITKEGYQICTRDDEVPSKDLMYIMKPL